MVGLYLSAGSGASWDSSPQELVEVAEDRGLCAAAATPTTQISSWAEKRDLGFQLKSGDVGMIYYEM